MRLAILRFPGSNCDDDVLHVLRHVLPGVAAHFAWHKDPDLGAVDGVVIPGGFSYGDYLRAGALAAHTPIMTAVREFAGRGGPVLGICNGFQILCEAGLLDGALACNTNLRFECRWVHVLVEGRPTPWTAAIPAGRILHLPVAHAEGRYVHPDIERLENEGRVVLRYVDASGGASQEANPNGSIGNIAGIANAAGNVVGMMPHPERAAESILGSSDGRFIFSALKSFLRGARDRA